METYFLVDICKVTTQYQLLWEGGDLIFLTFSAKWTLMWKEWSAIHYSSNHTCHKVHASPLHVHMSNPYLPYTLTKIKLNKPGNSTFMGLHRKCLVKSVKHRWWGNYLFTGQGCMVDCMAHIKNLNKGNTGRKMRHWYLKYGFIWVQYSVHSVSWNYRLNSYKFWQRKKGLCY